MKSEQAQSTYTTVYTVQHVGGVHKYSPPLNIPTTVPTGKEVGEISSSSNTEADASAGGAGFIKHKEIVQSQNSKTGRGREISTWLLTG